MRSRTALVLMAAVVVAAACSVQSESAGQAGGGAEAAYYQEARAAYNRKPPDYDRAAALYAKAADLGHAAAQNDLGWMYQNGWGVPRDLERAVYWYRQSANQGFATGEANLGAMYENGRGVKRDVVEAVKWYRLAAGAGEPVAANNLGMLYLTSLMDFEQALGLFRKAAERSARGQANVGWMYQNGFAVERDLREAMKWYRLAADKGDAAAENNIGLLYRDGLGVAADRNEAERWFRRAAEHGERRAEENLRTLDDPEGGMGRWRNEKSRFVRINTQHGLMILFGKVMVRHVQVSGPLSPLPPGVTVFEVDVPLAFARDVGRNLSDEPFSLPTEDELQKLTRLYPDTLVYVRCPPYVALIPDYPKFSKAMKDTARELVGVAWDR